MLGGAMLMWSSIAQIAKTEPLAPDVARTKFQVEAGLKIELVAAEPLVESPAAMAWDEAGRLFVAENTGYPVGAKSGEGVGKIVEWRDAEGEGRAEGRSELATGVGFQEGVR